MAQGRRKQDKNIPEKGEVLVGLVRIFKH